MTKKRKRHTPEQIVKKLRDAEAMKNAGKDPAAVLQALGVSEATYLQNSSFGTPYQKWTKFANDDFDLLKTLYAFLEGNS